jgi:hypothetical protein
VTKNQQPQIFGYRRSTKIPVALVQNAKFYPAIAYTKTNLMAR